MEGAKLCQVLLGGSGPKQWQARFDLALPEPDQAWPATGEGDHEAAVGLKVERGRGGQPAGGSVRGPRRTRAHGYPGLGAVVDLVEQGIDGGPVETPGFRLDLRPAQVHAHDARAQVPRVRQELVGWAEQAVCGGSDHAHAQTRQDGRGARVGSHDHTSPC